MFKKSCIAYRQHEKYEVTLRNYNTCFTRRVYGNPSSTDYTDIKKG